jgi:bacterioferritin-associated ferredoxin
MYACMCRAITESHVRQAGRAGVTEPEELIAVLGLEDERCCGRCETHIERFVDLATEGWQDALRSGQLALAHAG